MISLSEAARRHGVDKGQLSRAVKAGKEGCGGFAICKYAVHDDDGRVKGFAFPADYDFPIQPDTHDQAQREPLARPRPPKPAVAVASARERQAWAETVQVVAQSGEVSSIVRTTQTAHVLDKTVTAVLTSETPQAQQVGAALADAVRLAVPLAVCGTVGYALYQASATRQDSFAVGLVVLASLGIGGFLAYREMSRATRVGAQLELPTTSLGKPRRVD